MANVSDPADDMGSHRFPDSAVVFFSLSMHQGRTYSMLEEENALLKNWSCDKSCGHSRDVALWHGLSVKIMSSLWSFLEIFGQSNIIRREARENGFIFHIILTKPNVFPSNFQNKITIQRKQKVKYSADPDMSKYLLLENYVDVSKLLKMCEIF